VRTSHHARSRPRRAGIAVTVLSTGPGELAGCLALRLSHWLCGAVVGISSELAMANPAALAAILNFSMSMHHALARNSRPVQLLNGSTAATVLPQVSCLKHEYRPSRFFFYYFCGELMKFRSDFEFALQLHSRLTERTAMGDYIRDPWGPAVRFSPCASRRPARTCNGCAP
jgi:hypothetical protein